MRLLALELQSITWEEMRYVLGGKFSFTVWDWFVACSWVADCFENVGTSCGSSQENEATHRILHIIAGGSQVILLSCLPHPLAKNAGTLTPLFGAILSEVKPLPLGKSPQMTSPPVY